MLRYRLGRAIYTVKTNHSVNSRKRGSTHIAELNAFRFSVVSGGRTAGCCLKARPVITAVAYPFRCYCPHAYGHLPVVVLFGRLVQRVCN